MFIDRVRLLATAGAGGKGCCSFRREPFVPRGGPNGGDGGGGGDIVLEATHRLTSLLDLSYHGHWRGNRGDHGGSSDMHGARAEDTIVHVPLGTMVLDAETNELIADLTEEGQRFVAAKGGRGGKGNARFATSGNSAPKFAELGEPGEENEYYLELKLIADVGTVGLPNAGKSTLLSVVSKARPKIADYPFTTLSPNLGVVSLSGYRTMTIADIPGIIEGAAEGKGLGHDFLRHIERTRVLLFLIDLGDEDPVETLEVLENELDQHSPLFRERRRVYVLNKADVTENRERFEEIRTEFKQPFLISAVTGEGVPEMLEAIWLLVEAAKKEEAGIEVVVPEKEYTYEAPFEIDMTNSGKGYRVISRRIERSLRMTDFENPDAVRHLQNSLQKMGLFKALKRLGAQPGDTVFVGEEELEYQDD